MKEVNQYQLVACLQSVGIQPGDGLLVHSAVQYLGSPQGGVGMYLTACQEVLTDTGTLAVPTFTFGFAKGEPFDRTNTPSAGMGAFSEYVRQNPLARRTSHPLQSIAIIGRYAADLSSRDTPAAFDPGSAFERMLELDFKILLLGAGVNAISMLHYSEQRRGVPYRYWKDFSGQMRLGADWEARTVRMFVRDLQLDPQLDLQPAQRLLEQRGQWHTVPLNYGWISSCRLVDFVSAIDELLAADPWCLVTNRPA
jgi:aminoglycoside N3'-acetyltransferase